MEVVGLDRSELAGRGVVARADEELAAVAEVVVVDAEIQVRLVLFVRRDEDRLAVDLGAGRAVSPRAVLRISFVRQSRESPSESRTGLTSVRPSSFRATAGRSASRPEAVRYRMYTLVRAELSEEIRSTSPSPSQS